MGLASRIVGLLWRGVNVPGERAFRRALRDPEGTQERLLLRYVRRNADTAFGRRHGFPGIRSVAEYRDRVPLSAYDDLAPWIERIEAGERGVLTREDVRHFALTGGSTRAAKPIPYTTTLQGEFRRALAPWMVDLFRRWPDLARGPAYWSVSPVDWDAERTPGGIPVGFEDDSAHFGPLWKWVVGSLMAVPADVRRIRDPEAFRYATALHLLRCESLRIVSVWHPSFLELLLDSMERDWESLLRDVGGFRSRHLARCGPRDYRAIWPSLGLVSCWGDGHAAGGLAALRAQFPHVEVQPKGLIATEAFVTVPYAEQTPVAIHSHFFEFLDEDGRVHSVHQLERDREYAVVVTTGGGFYRYRMGDRVRVDGFVEGTPSLRFVGREDSVCDLRGEKLSEGFVSVVLSRVFAVSGVRSRFAMLAPSVDASPPRYTLFLEAASPVPAALARALEEGLCGNPRYRECIRLGQLQPVEVVPVPSGAVKRYMDRCRTLGQRLGEIKPLALHPAPGWDDVLGRMRETGSAHPSIGPTNLSSTGMSRIPTI